MSVLLTLTRIVQAAAEADSPAVQVNSIVDGIQREMDVDVCTLYLNNESGDLALVASHGLGSAAIGRAKIPPGKGLVGAVASTRHSLNITDPAEHPAFHYIPGSKEEQFRSFCAVPLVRGGAVIGVLAVQRKQPRKLRDEEEAFLVTLGAQLALVVANWQDWELENTVATRGFAGVKGAPGIGMGLVHLCEDMDLYSVPDAPSVDREADLRQWLQLLDRVRAEVRAEQASLDSELSGEVAAIFDAYHMLLADPTLADGVAAGIRGGQDLPSALRSVIHHYAELFMAMDDPYLRARHEDIRHLGNRLYAAWRKSGQQHRLPDGPIILVGSQVSVSDIARIPREKLAGVACFHGSVLSHTAILCNALGVPAVLGIGEHKGIKESDAIIVDGNTAQVLLNPDNVLIEEYLRLSATESEFGQQLSSLRDQPAVSRDGVRIALYVNSGLTADIGPGIANGAEGLGLYRTEIPFMISETFPSEDAQVSIYGEVMLAYGDKPIYMRVLDVGSDKPLPYFPVVEENPALGWRGIRFCLDNTPLLITQLRAMLRARGGVDNLHIILPMVSTRLELQRFKAVLDDVLEQLLAEGQDCVRPRVGIMVEVPAAVSQLGKWKDSVDFVSIGSNDLSQYVIAVDRNNPRVAAMYDHLHPAVLDEISRVVAVARELGIPVSLCGEMSSDPHAVVLLVGMGMRTLSMSAAQLPKIKWLIRALDAGTARGLYEQSRQLDDSAEIRRLTTAYLAELGYPGLSQQAS